MSSPASAAPLGYVHSVETFGLVDGPGVRYVLFLQGCRMRCRYCHNPETWAFSRENAQTPREAFDAAYRYHNYWKNNGGLTVSGGEPPQTYGVPRYFSASSSMAANSGSLSASAGTS